MVIMRLCNVQTNEGATFIVYPIINIHHRLHSSNENKNPAFPEFIWSYWLTMMVQPLRTQSRKNMTAMGKADTYNILETARAYNYHVCITLCVCHWFNSDDFIKWMLPDLTDKKWILERNGVWPVSNKPLPESILIQIYVDICCL